MQAVILVGGQGTRIRALYPDRPKVLIPVAGKPVLQWQIEWLSRFGIDRVHLAAGYRAEAVRTWTRTVALPVATVTLSAEPSPLGTGGGLKWCAAHLEGDPFWVLNGDSLTPQLDLNAMQQAQRPNAGATLAVTRIREAGRYGTVEFDAAGLITRFREKAQHTEGWINAGVYLVDRALLDRLPEGQAVSLETDVFPALAAQHRLRAFPAPPPLLDMGTPEGLQAMQEYLTKTGGGVD